MTKNGEGDIVEVLEDLLKKGEINEKQRGTFFDTDFWSVMSTAADLLKVEYSPVNIPLIIKRINEKSPHFFDKRGADLPIRTFKYEHPPTSNRLTPETISDEEKLKLITIKEQFNSALDVPVSRSYAFDQWTGDFDIGGGATSLPIPLREKYKRQGDSRIESFRKAIYKHGNDNDNINVFMRVFDVDNQALAAEPAVRLVDAGVSVWNHFPGQRYGCGRVGELYPNCRENLKKLFSSFSDFKNISEVTGIDKKTLEKIAKCEIEVKYRDAKALQNYFSKQLGSEPTTEKSVLLTREIPYIFTIEREFARGTKVQATEPQIHVGWEGNIIYYWERGCNALENDSATFRTANPSRRVKRDDLIKYLPVVS